MESSDARGRWEALALAALAVAVGVAVAAQRHQFTHPGLASVALIAAVAPWMAGCAAAEHHYSRAAKYLRTAISVAGTFWLVLGYPNHTNDYAPFLLVIAVAADTADVGPRFGASLAVASLVTAVTANLVSGHDPFSWTIWAFAFSVSWLGGLAYRWQEKLAARLVAAQEELGRRAAEEQRRHLAREVHDLIAHTLAVSMLHMTAARLALTSGEAAEAARALEEAERAGRTAMAEIHRTVSLLGAPEADAALGLPVPTGADLPALIASFRQAGLDLATELHGDLGCVPLATGLAAYRIIQESLANAVKHGDGSRVDLSVACTSGSVRIRLANRMPIGVRSGPGPGGGNGIRGMTERAAAIGGAIVVGEVDGYWTIEAELPIAVAP